MTEVVLRILRKPEATRTFFATFPSTDEAGAAVSAIIASGIVPAAIEMMDRLAIEAAKAATGLDWPDVGAALLMDADGPAAEVEHTSENAIELARKAGAIEIRRPRDEAERALMWKGRKSAFAAVGRISPNYFVQDGVIPRSEIARVLREIDGARARRRACASRTSSTPATATSTRSCSTTRTDPGQEQAAEELGGEILRLCVRYGGSITGEHGVGFDKAAYMPVMFSAEDLDTMGLVALRLRSRPAAESRQGLSDAAALRRPAGPAPRAPRRSRRERSGGNERVLTAAGHDRRRDPRRRPGAVREPGDGRGGRRGPRERGARPQERLLFVGGGTDLDLGAPPERLDVLLRTRRLDRIVEHAPSDQIAVVEAGVTAGRARPARSAPRGQRLALDPPLPERATVGGIVAANAFGPRRARYGSVRDLIIGVTIVRADGVVAHGGGKVVKNVAGFDLPKLMVGSLGTLGLIATATFRLHPLPEESATLLAPGLRTRGRASRARRGACGRRSSSRTRSSRSGRRRTGSTSPSGSRVSRAASRSSASGSPRS